MIKRLLVCMALSVVPALLLGFSGCGPRVEEAPELTEQEKAMKMEEYKADYEKKMKEAMDEARKKAKR